RIELVGAAKRLPCFLAGGRRVQVEPQLPVPRILRDRVAKRCCRGRRLTLLQLCLTEQVQRVGRPWSPVRGAPGLSGGLRPVLVPGCVPARGERQVADEPDES